MQQVFIEHLRGTRCRSKHWNTGGSMEDETGALTQPDKGRKDHKKRKQETTFR